jgi:hypothetical protein
MLRNMTDAIRNNLRSLPEPEYFGDCPRCGSGDCYLNVYRAHWYVCDACQTRWPIGENLFSSWEHEKEELWERNQKVLQRYAEVNPWHRWAQLWRTDIPLALRLRNLMSRSTLRAVWERRLMGRLHALRWKLRRRQSAHAVSHDIPF